MYMYYTCKNTHNYIHTLIHKHKRTYVCTNVNIHTSKQKRARTHTHTLLYLITLWNLEIHLVIWVCCCEVCFGTGFFNQLAMVLITLTFLTETYLINVSFLFQHDEVFTTGCLSDSGNLDHSRPGLVFLLNESYYYSWTWIMNQTVQETVCMEGSLNTTT